MIVKSGVTDDARVLREARSLVTEGHEVEIIGDRPGPTTGEHPFAITWARPGPSMTERMRRSALARPARWMLLPEHRRREEAAFARAVGALDVAPADVVHAHDLTGLVPGAQIAEGLGALLVYDSHECWSGRRMLGRPTPIADRRSRALEARLGDRADEVVTISDPLADWFRSTFGWRRITVVRNTFPVRRDSPERRPAPSTLLYAGRIGEDRDLATAAAAAPELPVPLDILGGGDGRVIDALTRSGVSVREAVPIAQMDDELHSAGLSLVSLADNQLNHRIALPNKLFQAVQVGVPVVAADLPAIAGIVHSHGIGTLYRPGDARSLVTATEAAIDRYATLSANVLTAQDALSWERDAERLADVYERLTAKAHR